MNTIGVNFSWWNSPIGYDAQSGKSIAEWRNETSPDIIRSMSPITLASSGSGVIGLFLCFLGIATNKKSPGVLGFLACLAGLGGFVYNCINNLTSDTIVEKAASKKKTDDKKEQPKPESPKVPTITKNNPFFKHEDLCTSDPGVLIVDTYDGILNGKVDKVQDVIQRTKKLDLEKSEFLLNNKFPEVRGIAILALISRDDFNENPEIKNLILRHSKKDDLVVRTLRELVKTEKDNKDLLKRVMLLLVDINVTN